VAVASSRWREAVVPAYLFLCLLLGGSAQGIWVNAILQLFAVAILVWAAIAPGQRQMAKPARLLCLIAALALLLVAIQLIPLPPAVWSNLPGREVVTSGYTILGQPLPWLPIALVPDEALTTVLRLLPPVAILAAMFRLEAYRPSWLAWALVAGTSAGVVLGTLQVTSGAGTTSPWYPYPISNFGTATGFFANGNHMAILLVATIPFLFAIMAGAQRDRGGKALQRRSAMVALTGGMLAVILLGLILNGSLAGFGLGLPVLAASALLLLKPDRQRRWLAAPALLLLAAVGAVFTLPVSAKLQSLDAGTSVETRRDVAATTWAATREFMPVGSGVGSFEKVYRLYEDPSAVDRIFVNHAHNDYLEIALETGLPGVVLVLLFLAWLVRFAWNRWNEPQGDPFAQAATIASAAILAHSLVDFPLRTSAMAGVFAVAIALIAQSRLRVVARTESDLWPTRHVEIR
jgi:O-antigen ligase